ncbi:MAG: alpha-1,2-fucosyltransferase [Anaerolineales bacterium]|nr:alpha-1,2-fucosyltransferase [Anaerolineales bacterium]
MVITRLVGGLGNQLFQYAAGRSLAALHGVDLKLDLSPFEEYRTRSYSLSAFRIQEAFASPEEVARVRRIGQPGLSSAVHRLHQRLKRYYRRATYRQRPVARFDPNFFRAPSDVYLWGYWQSEKYFEAIDATIRSEFTIKSPMDAVSRTIADRILSCESVCLHVRRGDYVSDARINQTHGTCSPAYYRESIDLVAGRVENPHFFVFSDDPAWVFNHITIGHPTDYSPATRFVHNIPGESYANLLWLMSLCKHHIIANSSFSWWGAWLAKWPGQVVCAPAQWFATITVDPASRFPRAWELL